MQRYLSFPAVWLMMETEREEGDGADKEEVDL